MNWDLQAYGYLQTKIVENLVYLLFMQYFILLLQCSMSLA